MHGAGDLVLADGAPGVREVTSSRFWAGHRPNGDVWPTERTPTKMTPAKTRSAQYLEIEVENL